MYIVTKWTIADARRRFSEMLSSAAREPQVIYRRGRPVATVVAPDRAAPSPTIADAFVELRAICAAENYVLERPRRRDRPNPFARSRR
jgi:antitoxin (DNA-binding transcriptional repressor) of toxin-antitoxin stability system